MKIALLFPGQGSQFTGMCKSLLKQYSYLMEYFRQANEVLGFDLLKLCLDGPDDQLNRTEFSQPAILLNSFCAFQVLQKEYAIRPVVLAGHSLGEISALCCSGAIAFPDALRIVRRRGQLMQEAAGIGTGAMIAVNGFLLPEIEHLLLTEESLTGKVVISNINSPSQIVLSGEKAAVEMAGGKLARMGATIVPLRVSAPFHSPMMRPAALAFENELMAYQFSELTIPVISNVTNKPYQSAADIIPLLVRQIVSPVNWVKTISYLGRSCSQLTIELPPGKILTKLSIGTESKLRQVAFDEVSELLKVTAEGSTN